MHSVVNYNFYRDTIVSIVANSRSPKLCELIHLRGGGMDTIKPEKAQQILNNAGLVVSLDQATAILEFLTNLANISISVYLISDD